MPDETRRLLTAAERLAALTDEMSGTFAAKLSDIVRDIERRMAILVVRLDAPSVTGARTIQAQLVRLASLRDQVRQALTDAGYDTLMDVATTTMFDRVAETIRRTRAGRAATRFFTNVFAQRVEAFQAWSLKSILHTGEVIADALTDAVWNAVLGGTPTPVVLERIAETLDLQVSEVRTLYDTATATFGRVMEQQASDGTPGELFLYAGPVDAKMRPFCAKHIGQVFTREEITKLDNGQRLDVFVAAGGWNCRHTWMRLSPASELADLANTGERAPEVTTALRDVRPITKAKAA